MRLKYLLLFCAFISIKANSQLLEYDKDFHAADLLMKESSFSIHKDNYFLTGVPLNEDITRTTADVKYQVSFKERLSSKPLWGGFFLYLMYTQKAFWDIYASSKPFSEINFNPGVAVVRPFYLKGHRLTYGTISLEHESNGRDSIYSRTWNMLAFSLKSQVSPRWTVGLRGWFPLVDKEDNPDLLKYVGYGEASASYQIQPGRWSADIVFRKGSGLINYGSLQTQVNWKPYKHENYYLTLQWFVGYTESLIDYQEHKSMLRLGFVLKPENMGIF
ncbi:phospholipase A [Flavobacterium sp. MC2016-06]|jgi:phospholipase A1|uniref:phospholipase A n=1 Tax=Flavobacterium sp. MC2016-06 TaxID=2676308 RepID=UPI0012BA9EBF|nr:phospholipase A [Flavobacterium sp. MC2016-06]MBU3857544.1 phospholipase A [Flavobacterium sp. MC2016-06]